MAGRIFGTRGQWIAASLFIGLSLGVSSVVFAQQGNATGWETQIVNSRTLGQRTIYVAVPEDYAQGVSRYPIVVLLDANDHPMFRLWIAQAAYLVDNSSGFPSLIAVGIVNGSDRIHDMTPPATGSSVKDFKNAGGAAAFADFIIDEVLPHVRARYRTLPGTFLIGHSAGGLFAMDVAARRPTAFQGVIATDPALWFNDGTLVNDYVGLMDLSQTHPRLFLSFGGGERDLTEACKRFVELANATRSLRGVFSHRVYGDLTHTLVPMSVGDGLRFIFDPVSLDQLPIRRLDLSKADSSTFEKALLSSESTYAAEARTLGLSGQFPEQVLNGLGYRLLGNNRVPLAISVFKQNVQLYPESANVYDSLGDGFLAAADTASALAEFRRAVDTARRTGVEVLPETQRKLKELEAKK